MRWRLNRRRGVITEPRNEPQQFFPFRQLHGLAARLACVPGFLAERGNRRDPLPGCNLTVQDLPPQARC